MKLTRKHAVAAIILVLSFALPVEASEPYENAFAAFQRGDYATALRLFRPLAEQGDAASQYALGNIYSSGKGVPKNLAVALRWYRLAADQGFPDSQFTLGLMYSLGEGVPEDFVLSHMWFNLAATTGNILGGVFEKVAVTAGAQRNKLEQFMTPAQIAEAQKLARDWKPTKPSPR